MPPDPFYEIEQACAERLGAQVERVRRESECQRRALIAWLEHHAAAQGSTIEDIADQARLARAHLRAIVSGAEWWTKAELTQIAVVLSMEPAALLEPFEES